MIPPSRSTLECSAIVVAQGRDGQHLVVEAALDLRGDRLEQLLLLVEQRDVLPLEQVEREELVVLGHAGSDRASPVLRPRTIVNRYIDHVGGLLSAGRVLQRSAGARARGALPPRDGQRRRKYGAHDAFEAVRDLEVVSGCFVVADQRQAVGAGRHRAGRTEVLRCGGDDARGGARAGRIRAVGAFRPPAVDPSS